MTELRAAFATFIRAAETQAAASDVYLDSFGEALEAARAALSEPVAQEPQKWMCQTTRKCPAPGQCADSGECLFHEADEGGTSNTVTHPAGMDTAPEEPRSAAEWDTLIRERNRISELHAAAQRENDKLRAGMDAARAKAIEADAARYRWLIDGANRYHWATFESLSDETIDKTINSALATKGAGIVSDDDMCGPPLCDLCTMRCDQFYYRMVALGQAYSLCLECQSAARSAIEYRAPSPLTQNNKGAGS